MLDNQTIHSNIQQTKYTSKILKHWYLAFLFHSVCTVTACLVLSRKISLLRIAPLCKAVPVISARPKFWLFTTGIRRKSFCFSPAILTQNIFFIQECYLLVIFLKISLLLKLLMITMSRKLEIDFVQLIFIQYLIV